MQILANINYFLVCFAWLLAVGLKEYFHLPKAGFYLQQTLVNSGAEEQRRKIQMDQRDEDSLSTG